MTLLLLLLVIAIFLIRSRLPLFESTIGVCLLTPILAHIFLLSGLPPRFGYVVSIAILVAYLYSIRSKQPASEPHLLLFFAASFTLFYFLCLLWPDFFPIGERLRDYAVLNAVVNNPVLPGEPWMAGQDLTYYVYWYRVGAMIHSLTGLPVWGIYHALQAFTFSIFFTSIFLLFRRTAGFSPFSSLLSSLIIALGSNPVGLMHALDGEKNWWSASRIIPGTINEFPAWSFILGDLHPHYLNLCFLPFLILVLNRTFRELPSGKIKVILWGGSALIAPLWLYNANAWELPVIGILASCITVTSFLLPPPRQENRSSHRGRPSELFLTVVMIGALLTSLTLWSGQISGGDLLLRLVRDPIHRTGLGDMLRHFGLPLFLVACSTILLLPKGRLRVLALLLIGGSLFYAEALLLLVVLLTLQLIRLKAPGDRRSFTPWIEGMVLAGIVILIFPEIFYFDDSYGEGFERMNTIFKMYSSNWFIIHFGALALFSFATKEVLRDQGTLAFSSLLILTPLLLLFFIHAARIRYPGAWKRADGLSKLEAEYPGARATIMELRKQRGAVILEAQGKPYSYATHIATLSGQTAYLGWANHMRLLTRDHKEVDRRALETKRIYLSKDCSTLRKKVKLEGITFVIFGPLERKFYGDRRSTLRSCLDTVSSHGKYAVFTLPSG